MPETIPRAALDAGRIDLTDATDDAHPRLPPVTPGEVLAEEFLRPLGLSARQLAREISVPANRITAIVQGRRAITADTALRLAARFATTPEMWMSLQMAHDLAAARQAQRAA